ncbi:hypothetical protein [Neisseria meningitidis]|uniref:hypothetical protein n=1 Tax=Neisseria meningitidis TaxID=487 RepID=UPI001C654515|nr:hypothetical protein [Neisseria meningitidis]
MFYSICPFFMLFAATEMPSFPRRRDAVIPAQAGTVIPAQAGILSFPRRRESIFVGAETYREKFNAKAIYRPDAAGIYRKFRTETYRIKRGGNLSEIRFQLFPINACFFSFLDSHVCGNDGGGFFVVSEKFLQP